MLLIFMYRKSSHKMMAAGPAEGPHAAVSLSRERHTENMDVLIPMISSHFLDVKVSETVRRNILYLSKLKHLL